MKNKPENEGKGNPVVEPPVGGTTVDIPEKIIDTKLCE